MAERDLKLVIKAADEFSSTLKKYSSSIEGIASDTSVSTGRIKGSLDALKTHWLGATGVIITAAASLKKAYDFAESAAAFEQQHSALDNLARKHQTTADAIISDIQRTAEYTISKVDAITIANKGLMMGLDTHTMTKFTEVADALGDAVGMDLTEAFNKLTTAAATGQEGQLKQLGIMVDLQGAYETYATSIYKTVGALSEEEKQLAGVNAITARAEQIVRDLGEPTGHTADEFDRFGVAISETGLALGEKFLPYVNDTLFGINRLLGVIHDTRTEVEKLEEALVRGNMSKVLGIGGGADGGANGAGGSAMDSIARYIVGNTKRRSSAPKQENIAALIGQYINSRKMRATDESSIPQDPSQVWMRVPDYDALEADIKTREQNMVNGIIAAREEYQAQFAAAAITISGLLTEEQIAAIEMQKETRFEMESNYEDMLLDRHLAYSEQAMQIERNLQQTKMNLQFTAANHAIALMTLLGGKNKEFALIALAAQKGLAMAQVFISGEAAAAAALVPPPVGLGPIAGAPLATSIRAASYQSMALIAATGLVEAAMGAGGGPSGVGGGGGVGALPIAPPALSSDSSQGGETRIEINIINPMGNEDWDALAEEAVIPAFNRAVDRAVVVKATTIGG